MQVLSNNKLFRVSGRLSNAGYFKAFTEFSKVLMQQNHLTITIFHDEFKTLNGLRLKNPGKVLNKLSLEQLCVLKQAIDFFLDDEATDSWFEATQRLLKSCSIATLIKYFELFQNDNDMYQLYGNVLLNKLPHASTSELNRAYLFITHIQDSFFLNHWFKAVRSIEHSIAADFFEYSIELHATIDKNHVVDWSGLKKSKLSEAFIKKHHRDFIRSEDIEYAYEANIITLINLPFARRMRFQARGKYRTDEWMPQSFSEYHNDQWTDHGINYDNFSNYIVNIGSSDDDLSD